mmetsp:Transcript_15774/g.23690  ORF Transcript_15774/g.23690 Transcript_15774/m.23690 type:complete len:257 (-) Transcript_15774:133-903(-)
MVVEGIGIVIITIIIIEVERGGMDQGQLVHRLAVVAALVVAVRSISETMAVAEMMVERCPLTRWGSTAVHEAEIQIDTIGIDRKMIGIGIARRNCQKRKMPMVVAATVRVGTGEEKKIKMTVVRMVEGGAENMVSGDGGRVRDPDPGRVPETGLGIVRVGITAMGGGTMDHQVTTKTVGDHTRENLPPREGATVDVMEVPQNEQAREIDLGAEVGVGARAGAGAIVVIGVEVKILILIPAIEIHEGLIHHLFRDIK